METKYDVFCTDTPVCPFCGGDGWCDLEDSGDIECDCGKTFHYEASYSVDYSTCCLPGKHEWNEEEIVNDKPTKLCKFCGNCTVLLDDKWI